MTGGREGTEVLLWLHIYREGLCDPRQPTLFLLDRKEGLGLGFSGLRGRCQVTGSPRVIRDEERSGGRPPGLPDAPEREGGGEPAIRLGAAGLRRPERESVRENRFQNQPERGKRRGRKGLDGSVCATS